MSYRRELGDVFGGDRNLYLLVLRTRRSYARARTVATHASKTAYLSVTISIISSKDWSLMKSLQVS